MRQLAMVLQRFRRPIPTASAAERLYRTCVERARAPVFYGRFSVPDTIDGRFDLMALHIFVAMEALKNAGDAGMEAGTRLANLVFDGFEQALRELGVGDLGLSRRIKAMADAFYGRLEAYGGAGEDCPMLGAAILRNLFRGDATKANEAHALADYVISARRRFSASPREVILRGEADFGPLPES
jgi:cytochrome b pre-mRNA-processing protein 3